MTVILSCTLYFVGPISLATECSDLLLSLVRIRIIPKEKAILLHEIVVKSFCALSFNTAYVFKVKACVEEILTAKLVMLIHYSSLYL